MASGDSADVAVDGEHVASINGHGPRTWQARLAPGVHRVAVTDLGRKPQVVFDRAVEVPMDGVAFLQFRASYSSFWRSAHPSAAWLLDRRPRATWFAPEPP
jgi:hypothetical protein